MKKRSPYDHSSPSPSEELIGICHGLLNGGVDHITAIQAIKSWMEDHISEAELSKLEERDPLWCFYNDTNKSGMQFHIEWGKRIKNAKFLSPLPSMNYKPRIELVK